jgi:hypothetical protein
MASIIISHTHADGTLVEGSAKGDGVWEVLKSLRTSWRYMPSIGRIGLGQSRDRAAKTWQIERAAEALRAAGFEVTVSIDEDQRRDVAEIEADRAARAEARAERLGERAERTGAQAGTDYAKARQMAEAIPCGQPMMPDHHSYGRDRRYRDRMGRTYDRAFAGMDEAERLQDRAQAAEANQAHRESIPATLRRIAKLEAEARQAQRRLDGSGLAMHGENEPATGAYAERLTARAADLAGQLTYWRGQVEAAQASGVKVWSAADFTTGDYARHRGQWFEVARVNAKSLSVPWSVNLATRPVVTKADTPHVRPIAYDDIQGRKSADEMAALLAEVERREAERATA